MNLIKKIQEFKIKLQEDQRMQENFKDCKNNLQQSSSSFLFLSFFFIFFLNANCKNSRITKWIQETKNEKRIWIRWWTKDDETNE